LVQEETKKYKWNRIGNRLSTKDQGKLRALKNLIINIDNNPCLALVALDTEILEKSLTLYLSKISPLPLELHIRNKDQTPYDILKVGEQLENNKVHIFSFVTLDKEISLNKLAANLMFYRDYIPQNSLKIIMFCSHHLLRVIIEKANDFYSIAGFVAFFSDQEHQVKKDLSAHKGEIPGMNAFKNRWEDLEDYRKQKPVPELLLSKLFHTAVCALKIYSFEKSQELLNEALPLAQKTNNKDTLASIYSYMGSMDKTKGAFDKSLKNHKKALEYGSKINNWPHKARSHENLGKVYLLKGHFEKALIYLQQALEGYEKSGDMLGKAFCLGSIGRVFLASNDNQSAKNYFHKSLQIFNSAGHKLGQAQGLDNLGRVYLKMEQIDEAIDQFRKSLAILKKIGNLKEEAEVLINIGTTRLAQGDKDRAKRYIERALEIAKQAGFKKITEKAQKELNQFTGN